jgi:hypothetical protein
MSHSPFAVPLQQRIDPRCHIPLLCPNVPLAATTFL